MPRNRRRRRLGAQPPVTHFNPTNIQEQDETIIITPEEFEAIRLKDSVGLSQIEASARMGISQPTFHRQLTAARKKIADAIVNGKSIKIM